MKNRVLSLFIGFILVLYGTPADGAMYRGRVVDAISKNPIVGAFVSIHDTVVQTDETGAFQISREGVQIGLRAYGHLRKWTDVSQWHKPAHEIALDEFRSRRVAYLLY